MGIGFHMDRRPGDDPVSSTNLNGRQDTSWLHGRTLGKQLCSVLGLDPSHVARVMIECSATDVAKVTVEYCIDREDGAPLASKISRYHLVTDDPAREAAS